MPLRKHRTIGPAPHKELCAVLNVTKDFKRLNLLECRAYIYALRTKYGKEPKEAQFAALRHNDDLGLYYEVVCLFDPDDVCASAYAARAQRTAHGLDHWHQVKQKPPVTYDDANQAIRILKHARDWPKQGRPPAKSTKVVH